jgi:hypothetical protein
MLAQIGSNASGFSAWLFRCACARNCGKLGQEHESFIVAHPGPNGGLYGCSCWRSRFQEFQESSSSTRAFDIDCISSTALVRDRFFCCCG